MYHDAGFYIFQKVIFLKIEDAGDMRDDLHSTEYYWATLLTRQSEPEFEIGKFAALPSTYSFGTLTGNDFVSRFSSAVACCRVK